jgi:hypothetical protein
MAGFLLPRVCVYSYIRYYAFWTIWGDAAPGLLAIWTGYCGFKAYLRGKTRRIAHILHHITGSAAPFNSIPLA